MHTTSLRIAVSITLLAAACGPTVVDEEELGKSGDHMSFDEFEAQTYHEPWEDGVYIVNGDTPVEDIKKLEELYHDLYGEQALAVARAGGADARWSSAQQRNLTYCVSNTFGSRKAEVVQAMATATDNGWEKVAGVDFIYSSAEDGNCTSSNPNVVFDVRPVDGAPYMARAFFPNQNRSSRNVLVDTSAFFGGDWPLDGILLHELGHALGFRHEHTRPEAGACFEDSNYRPLTPYDSTSVMHYPHCNGTGPALTMSARDAEGASALYGPPVGGTDPDPPPPEGTPRTVTLTGQVAQGESQGYEPMLVVPGTTLRVSMNGTGDADLYVRFGSTPNQQQYDCRPYRSDSDEACTLDVPAGASEAHVMVYGYSASSFEVTASWTAP